MSIYCYDEDNPHPSGFYGLRVIGCVGGEHRQQYLSFNRLTLDQRIGAWAFARRLDAYWQAEAELARAAQREQARPTARASGLHATGVRGIRAVIAVKRRRNLDGSVRVYRNRAFGVHCSHNGVVYARTFRFTAETYARAWSDAVRALCAHKGIVDWGPLIARRPPIEQFDVLELVLEQRAAVG